MTLKDAGTITCAHAVEICNHGCDRADGFQILDLMLSQGPELKNVEVQGDNIHVGSSAMCSVIVQGHGSAAVACHGHSMTQTQVSLQRFAKSEWVRVTVIDEGGKRAWSNPI